MGPDPWVKGRDPEGGSRSAQGGRIETACDTRSISMPRQGWTKELARDIAGSSLHRVCTAEQVTTPRMRWELGPFGCSLDFGPRLLNGGLVKTRSLFSFPSLTRSGCQSTRATWWAPAPLVLFSSCCTSLAWSGADLSRRKFPCAAPRGPVRHKWWPVRCRGFLPHRSWTVSLHLLWDQHTDAWAGALASPHSAGSLRCWGSGERTPSTTGCSGLEAASGCRKGKKLREGNSDASRTSVHSW